MKKCLLLIILILTSACSDMSKKPAESKVTMPLLQKGPKKISSTKKAHETKKSEGKDLSGTLSNGTLYEAAVDEEGYIISFDPFIAKKDDVFLSATSQLIAKLYSDSLKDESRISIETDIGYTIFTGLKRRYKIIPNKENSGEISSLFITAI